MQKARAWFIRPVRFPIKPVADAMQSLHIDLFRGAHLDKAHGRTGNSFGDRLGIIDVVLLDLT